MDVIDMRILEILQNDAKLTTKEIAAQLSLTPTPVYERIKKMERSGVIKQYVALLDPEKLNKAFTVFVGITIKEHGKASREDFLNSISSLDDILELYHVSGTYDFMAKVRFGNVKEYKNFLIDKIASITNISDIHSQIVLEELRSNPSIKLS